MSVGATTARLVKTARDPEASLEAQHTAFTRLVLESQHSVYALALSLLRDAEEARDVAQDAFTLAWRRLPQLRDPAAFPTWLKSIVARECARRRRTRRATEVPIDVAAEPAALRIDYQSVVVRAIQELPEGERDVTVLFYLLGYSVKEIARQLRLKHGTVGKRLHSARLRIRRGLPRSVRADFVRVTPSPGFADRVRRGVLDEYIGDYRFERRPDLLVSIRREGDSLISESGGQRHTLVSSGDESLVPRHYDGEGRFRRNRRGQVTHFVYYEFGKRLGVARKIQ